MKTNQIRGIEFKAVIHIIFVSIAKIIFSTIGNSLFEFSNTPLNDGVPKKILFKRKGKNINIGLKVKKIFLNSEKLNLFLLIKSYKKKERRGNKVINIEILKSVARDIITITLK